MSFQNQEEMIKFRKGKANRYTFVYVLATGNKQWQEEKW